MRVSWLSINRTLIGAGLLVACSSWFVPSAMVKWISTWESASNAGPAMASAVNSIKDKKTADSSLSRLPIPSADDIEKASAMALRRMQPPKPAPPPEPPPVVAVAPVEVKLFAGSLIGVIRDSDPKYCYAVLKWQDNRIQLVATGGHLTDADDSPTVSEVNADTVTIEKGERKQTLELRGGR